MDLDLLNTYFEIDATMQASIADATQGFWESFPGTVEM
jgi:hypothetical protein